MFENKFVSLPSHLKTIEPMEVYRGSGTMCNTKTSKVISAHKVSDPLCSQGVRPFVSIEVMRHPVNPNFYGVTLLQGWTSGKYHDDGYLFLLWDFTDENVPQIRPYLANPTRLVERLCLKTKCLV